MQVYLTALGAGDGGTLTLQAETVLKQAGCILGAERLLQHLPEECTKNRIAAVSAEELLRLIQRQAAERIAVVFSGDSGFYSGARSLMPLLHKEGIDCAVLPGISSVQMLAAALGRPWQDWLLVSAHGQNCDAVAAVLQGKPTFFLTGGMLGPGELCETLTCTGLGALSVTVGENLCSPKQKLISGTAKDFAARQFDPLSVLLTEAAPCPPCRTGGLPDSAFMRGDVPMTKQLVRAAILAKLAVRPSDVAWDVGAGTGSVSVELAMAALKGRVYAVEGKPEACELICQNRERFCAWNLNLIEGWAPQALQGLPAPDAVFIGGTKKNMAAVVQMVLEKNQNARVCISAIALETVQEAMAALAAHGIRAGVVQVAVSETKTVGGLSMLMANNPIFLITGNCDD